MESLIGFGGVLLLGALFLVVRGTAARRRRSGVRAGRTVRCRASLGFGHAEARRGRLFVSARRAGWARWRLRSWVELTGGQVMTATAADSDDVALRITLPDGRTPHLILRKGDAALLTRILAGDEDPREARDLMLGRRWPFVVYTLVALWVGVWLVLVVGGHTVRATVTANDDGLCDVVWTDADGSGHGAEVDCGDEKPGDARTIWVLIPPLRGEAVDPAWTIGGVGVIAAVGLLPALAGSVLNCRDRWLLRSVPAPTLTGPVSPDPALDHSELTEDALRPVLGETPGDYLARLAPRAARQVRPRVWLDAKVPEGTGVRPSQQAIAGSFFGPGVVALITAQFTLRPWMEDGRAPRYWLPIALIGGAIALVWAGSRTVDLIRTYRLLHRQATTADRPALGTVTSDGDGDPVLLLCDPVITPPAVYAIALRTPLPAAALQQDAPLRLRAHGTLAEGEPVVARLLDGALLVPAGPAIPADTQTLRDLLDPVGALRREHQPDGTSAS